MRDFCHLFGFSLLLLALFLEEANYINAAKQSGGVYIVYLGTTREDHAQLVSRLLMKRVEGNSVVQTYGKSFSGFAAHLSDAEAKSIARQPEVVSVFRDRASKLHTTRSWDFLMSQNDYYSSNKYDHSNPSKISSQSVPCSIGADTIIGVIDTGIWPEHVSFEDKLMGPIPTRWKGECNPGNSSKPFECNKKLIGARCYTDGCTTRDTDGHGTHTTSTAAGNLVWGASYKGLAEGIAKGGSPCSRIAAYKIFDDDLVSKYSNFLKAFDDAIADGVDVLSIPNGGEHNDVRTDAVAIGAFHAVEKGITVVCSVGNRGPSPETVQNYAPWIISVGASTIDRVLEVAIVLGGNRTAIKGSGINFGDLNKTAVYPFIDGMNCVPGSLDDAKVKGKIVLCYNNEPRPHIGGSRKVAALTNQGVIGVVFSSTIFHQVTNDYFDYYHIPVVGVTEEDGAKIQSYINSANNPLATLLPTVTKLNYKPAPVVAVFSSRGPARKHAMRNVTKPDVVAPGVNILAGVPPDDEDQQQQLFDFDSGTSMSCPHVSGLAAMLKSVHPTWTPSAIKSAIMTTAIQTSNLHSPMRTHNGTIATPHEIGSGEINPSASLWPGLVYETSTADYVQFLCNMGYNTSAIRIMSSTVPNNFSCPANSSPDLISDMNYPSIYVSGLNVNVSRTVKRTVTNVGKAYSTYTATVVAPTNVEVRVVPKILRFTKNVKTLTFQVSFKPTTNSDEDRFGAITWCNGKYINVRSPFVVSSKA